MVLCPKGVCNQVRFSVLRGKHKGSGWAVGRACRGRAEGGVSSLENSQSRGDGGWKRRMWAVRARGGLRAACTAWPKAWLGWESHAVACWARNCRML